MSRSFHQELVLNHYMLRLFNCSNLNVIKDRLGEDRHEGIVEDGQSGFFHALQHSLFQADSINPQDLRRYDLNIVQHWNAITGQRNKQEGTVLNMKYFQYLSLLFTEIYLDRYFNQRQRLLDDLNESVQTYNRDQPADQRLQPYGAEELNKLAFWNATGSGKTLLLHVNILQYLHYFQSGNANAYPDKIILLTPNEGLSRQHIDELMLSGIGLCRLFDKNTGNVLKGTVEVIDINKLGDDMGDKTVAVEAFEGNNLVLVDEGHRGTRDAGVWMARREKLVRGGFAFEYSATFGQAVAKSLTVIKAEQELIKKKAKKLFETASLNKLDDAQRQQLTLTSEEKRLARTMATRESYAKSILFDYSYKFFYEDGYGKESLILNLKDQDYEQENIARQYFTACLLSFYQQQYLWQTHQQKLAEFNIEKPLWVFVGNTVSGEDSDILSVLRFLAGFLNDDVLTRQWLADLLNNTARLLDARGNNIFHDRFTPMMRFNAEQVYSGILKWLFNTDSRQRLKVVNLKRSKGELVLRVGAAEPFGLINIGDDAGFFKAAGNPQYQAVFDTATDDFGETLFDTINDKDSKLHMLIGSRKFTEGWSSWRVSTMGLLNMGQGEGSQIIQLFGRGVRLKGRDYSLKRSIPGQRPKGLHLERLETLNIFGVNAGYMAAFKDYLKEEGITPTDEIIELNFKTHINLPKESLKTLALQDGYKDNQINGFKRVQFPWLFEIPDEYAGKINLPEIELDLYPKIEALSAGKQSDKAKPVNQVRQQGKISSQTMALFDFDRIYLALQEYKQLRSWSNLRLTRSRLKEFCLNCDDWYTLYIPPAELAIRAIADIRKQEDILIRLLQDYTARFYKALKTVYESRFYDIDYIKAETENGGEGPLLKSYHFSIDPTDNSESYEEKIKILQTYVEKGEIGEANRWNAGQMVAICFDSHLYYPLFSTKDGTSLNSGIVPFKMRPLAFDSPSEVQFVYELEAFYQSPAGRQIIGKRSLYLLRNADNKAKGLGFALAGNFYPDFLLWLVDNETGNQWLNFVDPKGLRQMSLTDPKLQLYREVKKIQEKLADPKLTLNAFIVSATRFANLLNVACDQSELEARNVLFMDDGGAVYLKKMFDRMEL